MGNQSKIMTERLEVRLAPQVVERVRSAAERDGETIAAWVRRAILAALRRVRGRG